MEPSEAVNAFEQVLGRLREVVAEPETAIIRDAAIKRFEFTFELAWKAIQRYLRDEGITCRPRRAACARRLPWASFPMTRAGSG